MGAEEIRLHRDRDRCNVVITPAERVPMSPADQAQTDRLCELLRELLVDRPIWSSIAILEAVTKSLAEQPEAAVEPSVH